MGLRGVTKDKVRFFFILSVKNVSSQDVGGHGSVPRTAGCLIMGMRSTGGRQ